MSVIVVGVNHRTVPLELLERLSVDATDLPKVLHDLRTRPNVSEAIVLSTCNRTEVYAVAERFHGAVGDVREALCRQAFVAPEDVADHLYTFHDDVAIAHLFSVAAGLDSAVLGESEILGQVKSAWEVAQEERSVGSSLNMVFRHAVEVGKRARSETAIGRHTTSVSQAAVALAGERLGSLEGCRVLVLGAGAMGRGMAVALAGSGAADVAVANRTWERAVDLAAQVDGRAVPLADLAGALTDADVLLTSTGATSVMVDQADLEAVTRLRGGRQLLIVDVAVPRDVDPAAAALPGITLLDMDDLRAFAEAGLAERRREVTRVREIVEEEVVRHREAVSARRVAPLVAALRERLDDVRRAEVERHAGRIQRGADPAEVVDAVTRAVLNKVLHEPTVRLKDAAGSPRGDRLADALRELFDLEG